jgi:hypothetical protein
MKKYIHQQYFVSFTMAVALKTMGYDDPSFQYYYHSSLRPEDETNPRLCQNRGKWEKWADYDDCIVAPLFDQGTNERSTNS